MRSGLPKLGKDGFGMAFRNSTDIFPDTDGVIISSHQISASIKPKSTKVLGSTKETDKLFIRIVHGLEPNDPISRGAIESKRMNSRRALPQGRQKSVVGNTNYRLRTRERARSILSDEAVEGRHDEKRENSKRDTDERQPALCEGPAPLVTHQVGTRTVTLIILH